MNVTPKRLLVTAGGLGLVLVVAGWNEPSAFMARPRQAVVTGCVVESYTVPGLLTQGSSVVMAVKLLETDRDPWIPSTLGAAKGLDRDNYRFACPVGKRYDVWWDPRFPDRPHYARWTMTPYVTLVFGVVLALIFLGSAPARKAEED